MREELERMRGDVTRVGELVGRGPGAVAESESFRII